MFLKQDFQFIYKVFQNLGYPNIFIHKCHSITQSKFYGNRDRVQFNQDTLNVISLPYNKNLDYTKKDLRKTGVEFFNYPSMILTSIIKKSMIILVKIMEPIKFHVIIVMKITLVKQEDR